MPVLGLVVGIRELYVEVALFTFILANIVYISPMECEVVAVGEEDVVIALFGVPFSVLLVIRVYMSFREWKVDEGEAEGVSLEKPKATIATRDMRRIERVVSFLVIGDIIAYWDGKENSLDFNFSFIFRNKLKINP